MLLDILRALLAPYIDPTEVGILRALGLIILWLLARLIINLSGLVTGFAQQDLLTFMW